MAKMKDAPKARVEPAAAAPAAPELGPSKAVWVFLLIACVYMLAASKVGTWGDSHWMEVVADTVLSGRPLGSENATAKQYSIGSAFMPGLRLVLIKVLTAAGLLGPSTPTLGAWVQGLPPALAGAVGAALFYLLGLELYGAQPRPKTRGLLLALALAFGSPYWHYARLYYSEGIQSVLLILAFLCAVRFRKGGSEANLAVAGAALGALFAVKQPNALIAPLFCLYWFFSCRERFLTPKALGAAAAGILPLIALVLWSNSVRYGGMFGTGYVMGRSQFLGFATPLLTGLYGLYLSTGKSLFLYCPLLFITVPALAAFHRAWKWEARLALAVVAVASVLYGRWWAWSGDWAWGARFMAPYLSCLLLPLGYSALFEAQGWGRWALRGVAAASLGVQLLSVSIFPLLYLSIVARTLPNRMAPPELRTAGEPYQIRDEQLEVHFVPEFSPILGNAWLLARLELPELIDRGWYPWKSIHEASWTPQQLPDYDLDFWWVSGPQEADRSPGLVFVVFALGLAGAGLAVFKLRA